MRRRRPGRGRGQRGGQRPGLGPAPGEGRNACGARPGGVVVYVAAVDGEGSSGDEACAKANGAQEAVLDAEEWHAGGSGGCFVARLEAGCPGIDGAAGGGRALDRPVDVPAEDGRASGACEKGAQCRAVPPVGRGDERRALGATGRRLTPPARPVRPRRWRGVPAARHVASRGWCPRGPRHDRRRRSAPGLGVGGSL